MIQLWGKCLTFASQKGKTEVNLYKTKQDEKNNPHDSDAGRRYHCDLRTKACPD